MNNICNIKTTVSHPVWLSHECYTKAAFTHALNSEDSPDILRRGSIFDRKCPSECLCTFWIVSLASPQVKVCRMSRGADVRTHREILHRIQHERVVVLKTFLTRENKKTKEIKDLRRKNSARHVKDTDKDVKRAIGDVGWHRCRCSRNKNTWSRQRNKYIMSCINPDLNTHISLPCCE